MRKIDKTTILSTVYKEWEQTFERDGKSHGTYNSSKNEFYLDVVFNLLFCQKGVCAYSETLLCADHLYEINLWEKGRYKVNNDAKKLGSLDHFNPNLKKDKAWLWDNLFMVHSDLNRDKAKKEITFLPKPDSDNYLPEKYFEYDSISHIFFPNHTLEMHVQEKIKSDILILGINHPTIVSQREQYIQPILERHKYTNDKTLSTKQFFTALEMSLAKLS